MNEQNKTLRVLVNDVQTKDGKKFKAYKAVSESGLLVDLRFKLGTDRTELDKCKKAEIVVADFNDASARYEFPRFYAGQILSVKPITLA